MRNRVSEREREISYLSLIIRARSDREWRNVLSLVLVQFFAFSFDPRSSCPLNREFNKIMSRCVFLKIHILREPPLQCL